MNKCTFKGCNEKRSANGLCHKHYMQDYRTGVVKNIDRTFGDELPRPKPSNRSCRACHQPLTVNRFYHTECLEQLSASSVDDEWIYS